MKQLYKVVEVDCKLDNSPPTTFAGDPAVERALAKVTYRPLLTRWPQKRDDDLFIVHDAYNQQLADHYWRMAEQSHRISPCGELIFEHIWSVGREGLRADLENGVVFVGHSVDWGPGHFRWFAETGGIGFDRWEGPDAFVADFGETIVRQDNVVMMKHPGHDIFGHWLLDFVPQLAMTRYMDLAPGQVLVFENITPWMQSLLDALGIGNAMAYHCPLSEHRNLQSPTGLKNGYALAQPINMMAWNQLRAHFNHLAVANNSPTPDKIYVSRKNWGGQRPLPNAEGVERLMTELGFAVFYPEQHNLVEQARVFSNARIVVGEDGSALHSLIFTRPGARLGVLMHADRTNLWHAGICHSMGHHIGYYQIADGQGQDLGSIRTFVDALTAA